MEGRIRYYNQQGKWGKIISPDVADADFFFHANEWRDVGQPKPGQSVTFTAISTPRGMRAIDVSRVVEASGAHQAHASTHR